VTLAEHIKETLYGLTKRAEIKVWEIEVGHLADGSSSVIIVRHGRSGGAATQQVTRIDEGKQGRTVIEQAIFEAKAKIKRQLDKNYRHNVAELFDLPLLPMLATDYRKQGHRMDYDGGVYVSDKLDGLRLLAKCFFDENLGHRVITLESRTGQPYSIPHIEAELLGIMATGDVLDGEAYLHGECLEDITSAVKRTDTHAAIDKAERKCVKADKMEKDPRVSDDEWYKANEAAHADMREALLIHQIRPKLQFVVFDVPSGKPWHERCEELHKISQERFVPGGFVRSVEYALVFSEDAMRNLHRLAVEQGYEGVMLRNRNGLYESGKRSADLQKYKEFLDAEFQVIGYTLDLEGKVVWKCKNDINDLDFFVIFGTEAEKAAMLSEIEARHAAGLPWLVRALKVKFQKRYKKTLLPQFPTGEMFRDGNFVNGEFVPYE